jgi:hypothetical protein
MNRSYLLVFIVLLSSCLDYGLDRRNIKILNKSSINTIYCFISQIDSFKEPYISYEPNVIVKFHGIKTGSFILIDDKPPKWDSYIFESKNRKMRIFVVYNDSLIKYGWSKIFEKNIFSKVYNLDIDDLNKMKWELIFDGK